MIGHNLTNDNYYKSEDYMSVSLFKRFLKCERLGLQPFGEPTPSMLIGSYVDAYIEGTLEEFKKQHPEIISSRGATKGKLKSDFQKAEEICAYIDNDKTFSQFMSGEKQTIMVGKIAGVPWKIKMDSYSPSIAINDLKVMATVTNQNGDYIDFITKWGYDLQLAAYQEIVFQNTGERLPVFVCAVTKESPINSVIVHIPDNVLYRAMMVLEEKAQRFWNIKNGLIIPNPCGKCEYCIEHRKDTPIISWEDLI